jgi:hypothetical protein
MRCNIVVHYSKPAIRSEKLPAVGTCANEAATCCDVVQDRCTLKCPAVLRNRFSRFERVGPREVNLHASLGDGELLSRVARLNEVLDQHRTGSVIGHLNRRYLISECLEIIDCMRVLGSLLLQGTEGWRLYGAHDDAPVPLRTFP